MGVHHQDMATEEEVAMKQEARAKQLAAQQALQAAEAAAKGYGQTNKAPEEGSLAGKAMEAIGA
jgi:hypothetical protein